MRAKESKKLPVVLSVEETGKLLHVMPGEEAVMANSEVLSHLTKGKASSVG